MKSNAPSHSISNQQVRISIDDIFVQAQQCMASGEWEKGMFWFQQGLQQAHQSAGGWHNLGVCLFALGRAKEAIESCARALSLNAGMWQSRLVMGRAYKLLADPVSADLQLEAVLASNPNNGQAMVDRADLMLNVFGQPLLASQMVESLLQSPEYSQDAQLTQLMAGLYDRDVSAEIHNQKIINFSRQSLCFSEEEKSLHPWTLLARPHEKILPFHPQWQPIAGRKRPKVGLISPLFHASPVYFLTIASWIKVAKRCDIVIFNRGHTNNWATDEFKKIAVEWQDVQEMDSLKLANQIWESQLDVLYDLGGWMDPIALKALSVKPARHLFKWVGGQSVTTGLDSVDGWIGDEWQSPISSQHLYTEPLINIDGGYASYTPPSYLPKPSITKRNEPVIFSNPAKLSRAFMSYLKTIPGKKCFVHQQFKYERTKAHVLSFLDDSEAEFICPTSHKDALTLLGQHRVMLDTFPYSSGLTAREAMAMGVEVKGRSGVLFCERHTFSLNF